MQKKAKTMNLFLDDLRNPGDVTWVKLPELPPGEHWQVIRTYNEFVAWVERAGQKDWPILRVSFDHDLSDAHYAGDHREKTGYHAAEALARVIIDKGWAIPEYTIHSMNPVAAGKIHAAMADITRFREVQDDKED